MEGLSSEEKSKQEQDNLAKYLKKAKDVIKEEGEKNFLLNIKTNGRHPILSRYFKKKFPKNME